MQQHRSWYLIVLDLLQYDKPMPVIIITTLFLVDNIIWQ